MTRRRMKETDIGELARRTFCAARSRALRAGLDVVESHRGWLWRVSPNGRRKRLRRVAALPSVDAAGRRW